MSEPIGSPEIVAAAVRQGLGAPSLEVTGARLLAGGAMHDSWGADGGAEQLVVRLSPPHRDDAEKSRVEFAVLKVMHERGARVPRPIYVGENERGQTFMLMERVGGDSNPRQLLTAPKFEHTRKQLITDLAEDLAIIHSVSPEEISVPLRGPAHGGDALVFELDRQVEEYEKQRHNPHPVVEWALRYVRRNASALAPPSRPIHVVHGDLRVGNLMYDERGLVSNLDWEGTHAGEAEEDLSWFTTKVWRFNRRDLEAGGIATREAWITAYERASGFAIDRDRMRLWEVLQNARWAVICMMQARQHLDGIMDSHEHAAIGRRAADTEFEILRLVGATA